jgi:hypothetical protein
VLSKSQYIRGLQCHKSLWLYKNKPQLRSGPDQTTESLFRIGDTVGDYAKNLFPGGVEIEFNANDFNGMIRKTKELLSQDIDTICDPTFKENGVFAMADIRHKTSEGWDMYEVKASTSIKLYQINDASIQWYALSDAIELNQAYIVHVNNQYVREGDLNCQELFTVEDITGAVIDNQDAIALTLGSMGEMIKGDMPDIRIGQHCSNPYECDFHDHCWANVPDISVFNLYRMGTKQKFELYERGVVNYEDIPDDLKLSEMQEKQVSAISTGIVTIDKVLINEFLDEIDYPVSFFDFETFQNAVPRFNGQKPYMQMPF